MNEIMSPWENEKVTKALTELMAHPEQNRFLIGSVEGANVYSY